MIQVIDKAPDYILLGNQNEHGVEIIEFDVSAWLVAYQNAVFSITYTRPGDERIYPVSPDDVGIIDGVLRWTVQQTVTEINGTGSVVIHCSNGGNEKRTPLIKTYITGGHGASGAPPEPVEDWVASANRLIDGLKSISFDVGDDGNLYVTIPDGWGR